MKGEVAMSMNQGNASAPDETPVESFHAFHEAPDKETYWIKADKGL
jgi:hypothetical protein